MWRGRRALGQNGQKSSLTSTVSGLNLLVFRGDRRRANGKELKSALIAQLEQRTSYFHRDRI